jgi:hypothetical protein
MGNTITVAVLDNVTGTWTLRQIQKGYKALQGIVKGLIQIVPTGDDDKFTLYCNEEGKIYGLPITGIWISPETGEWLDELRGDLVATGPADEEGEDTDATEAVIEALKRHIIPVIKTEKLVVNG